MAVVDMCCLAWSARNVGGEKGGNVSGVESVIVASSGVFLRFFSLKALVEECRKGQVPRTKPRVVARGNLS